MCSAIKTLVSKILSANLRRSFFLFTHKISSSSHVPIFPPRFRQRSFFSSQIQWGISTHKTRSFKKVTHCLFDMDGTVIDTYFLRELQYHKLLQNIPTKHGRKYSKELEPINTGSTDKDSCKNLVKELGRDLRVQSKITLLKDPLKEDSESQYHIILKEFCAKYGKKYTKALELKNYGATDRQICENVVKDLQLNMSATDLERELKVITKNRLPKSPLKKGVERLLKHLVRSGVLFALATNSTRRDVRLQIATKPKIFRMFHHIVCAGDPDVDRGKPFPDLYLMAASKFPDNPPSVKCLVFEDSLIGLEAGLAAGMQVVMTPPRSLPMRDCAAATLVLESLLDFKPELFGLPPFTDNVKNKPKVSKF